MDENKIKALDGIMAQIEKQYGKGSIMRLGQSAGDNTVEAISTGCLSLDLAIGIGGLPRGRIIEIYGPESSGKTTVALHCIAEAQKQGGIAAFIDAEHALDPVYAKNLGVNKSLKVLCLNGNGLTHVCFMYFIESLKINDSLNTLKTLTFIPKLNEKDLEDIPEEVISEETVSEEVMSDDSFENDNEVEGEELGYYDEDGNWVEYTGYYDEDGNWVDYEGYYDEDGNWVEYVYEDDYPEDVDTVTMHFVQTCFGVVTGKFQLTDEQIENLKIAHFKKIDLSDAIYVVNVNGYIGESTKLEIEYAKSNNKEIIYLNN